MAMIGRSRVGGWTSTRWLSLLLLLLAAVAPIDSSGQPAAPADGNASSAAPPATPLVYLADTIVTFRASVAAVPPARRAEIAFDRLMGLRPDQLLQPVRVEAFDNGHAVLVGDVLGFLVVSGDVDPATQQSTGQVAENAGRRLARVLAERARLSAPGQRLRGALLALVATAVLIGLVRLLGWTRERLLKWFTSKSETHRGRLRLGDVDFLTQFSVAVAWLARTAAQVGLVVLIALWVVFVLNQFPETQPWGVAATAAIFRTLRSFEVGMLRAVPGVIAVTLIVLVARFASRIAGDIFTGIQRGTIQLPGVHPETAGATRRLVVTMIWLFAIVVAYPLVPGSDSDAFKGVSVFLGLVITLGSTGVVGHMMSGLVLVYSRAMQIGDVVRVADIEGMVTEVGVLSVKITNPRKEEFTIPNTVIVGTTVKNYTRLAKGGGVTLSTSVTIGYDAPWRVVYEMLLAAADRTAGILKEPPPVVFQPTLSDFYVEYQLVVRLEESANRLAVLTELHQNIQDAFNERGVQIMSPHFEGQPQQPVVVPKQKWNVAPWDREGPPEG